MMLISITLQHVIPSFHKFKTRSLYSIALPVTSRSFQVAWVCVCVYYSVGESDYASRPETSQHAGLCLSHCTTSFKVCVSQMWSVLVKRLQQGSVQVWLANTPTVRTYSYQMTYAGHHCVVQLKNFIDSNCKLISMVPYDVHIF